MDNWSKCPRCNSNRVQLLSKWAFVLAFFGGAGCLIWIGLLFPLLWILVPVFLIVSLLFVFGKNCWQCQDCKHTWVVKKTTAS